MTTRRARVHPRLQVVGSQAPPQVELLHPGPGEGFTGAHRRIEGGILTADGALLLLPGLVAAAQAGHGLWLAQRHPGGALALSSWQDGVLRACRRLRCSGAHLGEQWLVAWRGGRTWAEDLGTGAPIRLPLGALEARARPWSVGAGASWLLGRSVIELASGRAPRSVGVADERLVGLAAGPAGAVVAWGRSATWVHAPGRGLRACDVSGPVGEIAFAPAADQALVETDEGVSRVDLATGRVLDQRADGRPAGFGWWVDPAGERRRWRSQTGGDTVAGPGLLLGQQLHGPAGLAWDLRTGQPVGPAATAGADLAAAWGEDLLLVEDQAVVLVSSGQPRILFELEPGQTALELLVCGDLAAVRSTHGVAWGPRAAVPWRSAPLPLPKGPPLLVAAGRELLAPSQDDCLRLPSQQRTAPPTEGLPCPPHLDASALALGLPLDGSTRAPDGSTWAWQDDGVLLRLRAPPPGVSG